jgi:hypothetical protein
MVGNTSQPSDTLHIINHEVMHAKHCTDWVGGGGRVTVAVSLLNIYIILVRFEIFMAMTMKNMVFWDVAPCGSGNLLTCDLVLFTCPEDGGDTFFQNFGSNESHVVLHPRRRYSSSISFLLTYMLQF